MKNIYLDDSYIQSSKTDPIPLIIGIGGIIIDQKEEERIVNIMKKEKAKYTHFNLPLKWNFKDKEIKSNYLEFGREKEYNLLLENSRKIRLNILKKCNEIDYKILFSCIQNYSAKKDVVKEKKFDLIQMLFDNLLMRCGNEANQFKDSYQVIMDWPADSNPKPLNRSYYYMFNSSKTISGVNNYCGKLSELGFNHSLYFTKCTHSPLLQFVDIIIGALKDCIEMHLKGSQDSCVGKEACDLFRSKIRNNKGKKIGYGIIVSSGNEELKGKLEKLFE